ncbi:hypothetical protein J3A83DRAFT_4185715 [Scleroderma citrinum]
MCLISVKTLLGMGRAFMKGGRVTPHFKVLEELDDARPSYAILSHRWGQGINYGELTQLPKVGEEDGSEFRNAAKFHGSNSWLEWFSRGWTLEELIAPKGLQFFKRNWEKKLRIHCERDYANPKAYPEERNPFKSTQCSPNHVVGCLSGDDAGGSSILVVRAVRCTHVDAVRRREKRISVFAAGNHPHVERPEHLRMGSQWKDSANWQCPCGRPELLQGLPRHCEYGTR